MSIPEITPTEFVARRQRGDALTLLDVREGWELGVASVPADQPVVHIPMGEVAERIGGRLFVVVGQAPVMEAWQVTRVGEREWQRVGLFETVVAPLVNAPRPSAFVF